MLIGLGTLPTYNYLAVQNWSSNIDGVSSIFGLGELYIPINKDRVHWLLLRVRMEDKSIELWDSLGFDETNQVFLHFGCCYLYDVHTREHQHDQVTLEEWSMAWSFSDQSTNSLLQGDINDCGISTLVTLALLGNGTRLRPDLFSQDVVDLRQTR